MPATAFRILLYCLLFVASASSAGASGPRAVILIIGDGMDDQQITIARNYLKGASGSLVLDTLPQRGVAQVLTVEDTVDGKPLYVADSANTATSLATGAVTSRGRISTSAGDDRDIPTLAELASAAGYRTGIVTTASVTDATPAAFAAHINFRMCEGPDLMQEVSFRGIHLGDCQADTRASGGRGSIAEQLADSRLDLILGGGRRFFDQQAEGESYPVAELARQRGFQIVTNREELLDAASAEGSARLLGLFSPGTMPVRLRGEDGRTAEPARPSVLNRISNYLGSVTLPAPMDCEPNPAAADMPSLQQMTGVALARLARGNERGFFLMVESASIDKQAHEHKPCGSIGEMEQLDEALATALDYAAANPDTLILVTADHSQAAQLIPEVSMYSEYPLPVYSPGRIARIRTPEGGLMGVNYATNSFDYGEHTGANVPLYANAEGRERVAVFVRQPEIFAIMRDYLGLPPTD